MKLRSNLILAMIFSGSLLQSCASKDTMGRPTDPSVPIARDDRLSNEIADQNNATYYTELSFERNSAQLTDDEKKAIRDLVNQSYNSGSVDQIKIMSWADQVYPAQNERNLSAHQQRLADLRNKQIKEYLKTNYPNLDISVYNMATKPTLLKELFHTSDARTKQAFLDAGMVTKGNQVSLPDKTSKSLVLSVLKE